MVKKYGALSVLNQAIPAILEVYVALLGKDMQLETNHDQDAYVIACSTWNIEKETFTVDNFESLDIRQFRRHNRARIKSQTERTYKIDGAVVAKNRKKRNDLKDDNLARLVP